MQIKKFTAGSYAEAVELVKKELGDEALILSTQTLRPEKGFRAYKGTTRVEVTAATDPEKTKTPAVEKTVSSRKQNTESFFKEADDDLNLKSLLLSLLSQSDRARSMGLKKHQLGLYQKLVENGVNERLTGKIFDKLNSGSAADPNADNETQDKKELMGMMERLLLCQGEISLEKKQTPKLVALVGPTGAGKTTTIAKLAAHYALKEGKKVAMVSLDTYRIGAVEQLRVYGDIMELPVEVAGGAEDFHQSLRKHSDKDLILIDTTGRCHKDQAHPARLKEIFKSAGKKVETHLVLNVTAQEKLFDESYKQFESLEVDRVLFTKLDEGINFGAMFNFALRTRVPFSYLTTGQRVPEDIEAAQREKVIRLIFN